MSRTLAALAAAVALVTAACSATPVADPGRTVPAKWTPKVAHTVISYGPHAAQRAEVHPPTAGGNRGVIVMVHGGGFYQGTPADARERLGLVMSQTRRGYGVLNVGYRLLSGNTNAFPTAVRDIDAAVRWVRANGRSHGLNPSTVIVAGESAGGTLAALAGVGWNANPTGALGRTERVDGWVAFAGIMDFTGAGKVPDTLGRAWLGPNANQKAWYRAASPIGHLDPADPPGYLVHGDLDPIVEIAQMDRMISAANAAKVPAGRIHYDRVDTGPSACRGHTPACGANADAFDSWIDKVAARRL